MKPALIAIRRGMLEPVRAVAVHGVGSLPADRLDAVEDARGQALDLNRALDVVLDRLP